MSRVARNCRAGGFLQIFFLTKATTQLLYALVQLILNVLHENIPAYEEYWDRFTENKDALLNLALPDIPYKTKKQTRAQEGGGFIQDLLTTVLSSLGFLML